MNQDERLIESICELADEIGLSYEPPSDLATLIAYITPRYEIVANVSEEDAATEPSRPFDGEAFIDLIDDYLETSLLPKLRQDFIEIAASAQSDLIQTRIAQQLVPSVARQLRSELEAPLRAQVAEELPALLDRFRAEALAQIRQELRHELRDEVKAEIRQEILNKLSLD